MNCKRLVQSLEATSQHLDTGGNKATKTSTAMQAPGEVKWPQETVCLQVLPRLPCDRLRPARILLQQRRRREVAMPAAVPPYALSPPTARSVKDLGRK